MIINKIKKITSFHRQNSNKKNVMIFSTARSGSTWLMELIASSGKFKIINEPFLFYKYQNNIYPLQKGWEYLLPGNDRKRKIENYFNELIYKNHEEFIPAFYKSNYHIITDQVIFKILRTKDMINWYKNEFNTKVIYLLRHPIATNLSRVKYSRLPLFLNNEKFITTFLDKNSIDYAQSILQNGDELQKKVLDWCLQNLPALKFSDKSDWFKIYYEDLVLKPYDTLKKLSDFLDTNSINRKMEKTLYKASSSSHLSGSKTQKILNDPRKLKENRRFLIDKWSKEVTKLEEENVFEILDTFNISEYVIGSSMPVK
jgi:hypothetical protein